MLMSCCHTIYWPCIRTAHGVCNCLNNLCSPIKHVDPSLRMCECVRRMCVGVQRPYARLNHPCAPSPGKKWVAAFHRRPFRLSVPISPPAASHRTPAWMHPPSAVTMETFNFKLLPSVYINNKFARSRSPRWQQLCLHTATAGW